MDTGTSRRVVLAGRATGEEADLESLVPVFLCSEDGWDVRRHTGGGRTSLRRALGVAWADALEVSVLVFSGRLVEVDGRPALTVDDDWALDPDGTTVPLEWLLTALTGGARRAAIAIFSLASAEPLPLDGLPRPSVLAVETSASGALLGALGDALAGGASEDGVIRLASLARALAPWTSGPPAEDLALMLVPSALALRELGLAHRRTATPDPDDLTGTVLPGRFLVEAPLGSGTFGEVYRARQLGFERLVAVKVLHRTVDDSPEDVISFARETRSTGRLHHPNVVRLYHCDITPGGRLFAAMELLPGETLAEAHTRGLDPDRALRRIREILAGLAAAHAAGLVHADVKPGNVMLVPDPTSPDGERAVLLDFGLALLRPTGTPLGGTPLYMAPEHMRGAPIDARADVYSVGLLIVEVLTGWRRQGAAAEPPLASLPLAPPLREVLAGALAPDPGQRFPSALEMLRAFDGDSASSAPASAPLPLAPLREADAERLVGREDLLRELSQAALFRRLTVLVAGSGMGKTSVLRAGLVPRLRALRRSVVYVDGRAPVDPPAADVWIVDQAEAMLVAGRALPLDGRAVVVAVRDEFLSALMRALPRALAAEAALFHLEPLGVEDGRAALAQTLALVRVRPAEGLVDAIVADLARQDLPGERRGGVYPPHLGLACLALRDAASVRGTVGLVEYETMGRLPGILRDHLDRVLDRELPAEATATARAVFAALVNDRGVAVHCPVDDLPPDADVVVDVLRLRGLIVPVEIDGGHGWALAHESLGPQVLKWADARDLDRRRAREIVRYHLLRSTARHASLLSARDLREVHRNPGVLDTIAGVAEWTAADLVRASQARVRVQRLQAAAGALLVAALLAAGAAKGLEVYDDSRADVGEVTLVLEPFDWDPVRLAAHAPRHPPTFSVAFWEPPPGPDDPPVRPIGHRVVGEPRIDDGVVSQVVAVPAGPAWVEIHREGCGPSWVPVQRLPGYLERTDPPVELRIPVPTCQAARADTVPIESGPFWEDGPADPPLVRHPEFMNQPERAVTLPDYRLDRTEVPVAFFAVFARLAPWTGIAQPGILGEADGGSDAVDLPVGNLPWAEARAFCRFLGKDLPTASQYEKAARGGWTVHGQPNPEPRRAVPWGRGPGWVNLAGDDDGYANLAPVRVGEAGASPYGVLQLAGNVWEWQLDGPEDQPANMRWIRGGSQTTDPAEELHTLAYRNIRDRRLLQFDIGFRCAETTSGDTQGVQPE